MRKPISKKLRFEIFKRDVFKCQYCGKMPPLTILEVDHIIPVIKGGKNNEDNLITSCFDCNRGKGKTELSSLPQTTADKIKILKEKEKQYKQYRKIQNEIEKRIIEEIEIIDGMYSFYFKEFCLSDKFKNGSVRNFIEKIGYDETFKSMTTACTKIHDSDKAIKYFCGICWNIIKNK